MNGQNKSAFTLVELIIVITLLSILGTIGFVSFQGYTRDARDSNRLSSLKNIEKGLQVFQVKSGAYPDPDKIISITASGTPITKQGEFGSVQSSLIGMSNFPGDPSDHLSYIYTTTQNNRKYQLLGYMEANQYVGIIPYTYANDYSQRIIKTIGDKIGIVLQENNDIITQSVDIIHATGSYKVILDNTASGTIIGTGGILSQSNPTGSCKRLLELGNTKDDIYRINPAGGDGFDVYCDMTTDGGGWTLVNSHLLGEEFGTYYNRNFIYNNDGINVEITPTGIGCGIETNSRHMIIIASKINWKKIKFTQDFYGSNSCWNIFGNTISGYNPNLIALNKNIDIIRNQLKMNTASDNIFDGVSNRCDNNLQNNFWHGNKGHGLRSAEVILRKNNLNLPGGLFTGVSCTDTSTSKWIYKNIFIK